MANPAPILATEPRQSKIEELVHGLQEMTIIELADFVQIFGESFDTALFGKPLDAEGPSESPKDGSVQSKKITSPRWHELRATSIVENPYPVLAAMREQPPVVIGEFGGAKVWYATRDADIRTILTHRYVSNDFLDSPVARNKLTSHLAGTPDETHHANMIPLAMEEERHLRVRPVLAKAVNPARVDAIRPLLEATAAELLDSFPEDEPVDLKADFGVPLTAKALARLVGLPDGIKHEFPKWSERMNFHMMDPQGAREAGGMFYGLCAALIAEKRKNPGDDATTDFIEARDAGILLNDFELDGLLVLVLHAGQEAHAGFANGLFTLLRHPDQLAKLKADWSLLPNCIDELLRYESPLRMTLPRHTNAPIELDGVTIPARDYILVSLAAANRDPARYECPNKVDITRKSNSHLAFGHGFHRCVGARLATMVSEIALRTVLTRFPQVRLALPPEQGCPWRPSMFIRRLGALPVILGPRATSSQ